MLTNRDRRYRVQYWAITANNKTSHNCHYFLSLEEARCKYMMLATEQMLMQKRIYDLRLEFRETSNKPWNISLKQTMNELPKRYADKFRYFDNKETA